MNNRSIVLEDQIGELVPQLAPPTTAVQTVMEVFGQLNMAKKRAQEMEDLEPETDRFDRERDVNGPELA